MKSLRSVLEEATEIVVPSAQEKRRLDALALELLRRTREAAKGQRRVRDVVLGGSFAKGTWLPKDVDIDIFVRMRPETSEREFERLGLAIGERATAGYPRGKKYAQHPYTEATVDGVKVNVVPCYDVEPGKWKSAADRSPYHLGLVEKMSEGQKLQVRLLKRFMKGVGVYGAEIESQGFSGYAAEVLVLRNGGFGGVLDFFADFKPPSPEEFFHLSDPVDENRDLARAISPEKVGRLILASRAFLNEPSLSYFRGYKRKKRPGMKSVVVALVFTHDVLSEDTLWGELKRTLSHVQAHLEAKGFKIARSLAASDAKRSSALLFLPEVDTLPSVEVRTGPSVDRRAETTEFLSRNQSRARLVWVGEDARVRFIQSRRFTSLVKLLEDVTRDVGQVGASKAMAVGIARSGRIATGSRLTSLASSHDWLRQGVDELVSDTIGTSVA
ncbi:MAG TPA: CCA tRNA nucleotidyltransferase [Nitrososphaerales archaeon]|nr:CCA tRNA nucleotidyltransferase [Nitrososphaerales archaeon]